MKKTIRIGVWETNSSSVHSICICTEDEYNKWKNGELLYDFANDILTTKKVNKWDEDNYSYEDFWEKCEYFEGFEEHYTTPHGEKIIAFGYYGEDR